MARSQSRTLAARTSARGAPCSNSRKPRTAKQAKAEHRGGEWGRGVAQRLRALKGTASVRAFAERVGLAPSLVSNYLNGNRLPESPTLRTLAERTGVSLDWLLLGDGGDAPRYRGQDRDEVELEADIAAWVNRALRQAYAPELAQEGLPEDLYTWRVDSEAIRADVVTRVREDTKRAAHESELHRLLIRLSDLLQREAALPSEDRRLPSVVDLATLKQLEDGIVAPAYRDFKPNPFATQEFNVAAYPEFGALEWGPWRALGDPPRPADPPVLMNA
ncbi:hypothetical protein tb265_26140 [Gemmatimonadetes bacterium T265]|nr:hypothetical protein tb265_26140 [Gemmatimonadetes bacterium T265]